ncbi:MAG: class I SAM-dependent methyltransferase [candidate division Zixibacteria bacterium]|nr:class I SAM-dependent methyltransferase [candidate division Zixibacteria bacterium]
MQLGAEGTLERGTLLVLAPCPVCGGDQAEPVAVGSDLAHRTTGDNFLAVCCRECGLVRLDPRPDAATRPSLYPPSCFGARSQATWAARRSARAAARLAARRCRPLPSDARLLELGYSTRLHLDELRRAGPPTWALEGVSPHDTLARTYRLRGFAVGIGRADSLTGYAEAYDAVLLLHALEHSEDPLNELISARRLLRPGGRVVILTANTDSMVARLFQGRHWAGYDFPRHLTLFEARVLRRMAVEAGYQVERIATVGSPLAWVDSTANLLQDWAALSWLARPARRGSAILYGLAVLVEAMARLRGRGAWLEAVLRKLEGSQR